MPVPFGNAFRDISFGNRWTPAQLFAGGAQGAYYNIPALSELGTTDGPLFQDSAGTTPVSDYGDPVGLVLDQSGNGNDAEQSTAAARPIYSRVPKTGRKNLFTYTEEINNAIWSKFSLTVSQNQDGVADLIYPASSGTSRYTAQTISSPSATHTVSAKFKQSGKSCGFIYIRNAVDYGYVFFDLSDASLQIISGSVSTGSATISGPDSDGYYTVTYTAGSEFSISSGSGFGVCDAKGSQSVTANGTDGLLVKESQIEVGAARDSYQKVVSQYDITEEGVEDTYYLDFDGVDDHLIITGTTSSFNFLHNGNGGSTMAAVAIDSGLSSTNSIHRNIRFVTGDPGIALGYVPSNDNFYCATYNGSDSSFAETQALPDDESPHVLYSDFLGTESRIFLDGSLEDSDELASPTASDAQFDMYIGSSAPSITNYLRGKYFGGMFIDSALSDSARQRADRYFASICGVSLT